MIASRYTSIHEDFYITASRFRMVMVTKCDVTKGNVMAKYFEMKVLTCYHFKENNPLLTDTNGSTLSFGKNLLWRHFEHNPGWGFSHGAVQSNTIKVSFLVSLSKLVPKL